MTGTFGSVVCNAALVAEAPRTRKVAAVRPGDGTAGLLGHTVRVTIGPIDDNASCWLAELPPYEPAPALLADVNADVVVIGGGMTGVSAAWHLARVAPGRRILVLEAKSLANGATGRSGGQVLNGINGIEPRDGDTARRLRDATLRGIRIVEELARLSTLDAGFRRDGSIEVTTTARSAERAHRRVEQCNAWGIPLRWIAAADTGLDGAHGAVLDPEAGCMNPAALVRGLRAEFERLGVVLHEHTRVTSMREGRTIEIATTHGRVRAAAVVLATNAYTPSLGYFRDRILPLHSRVVATTPLAAERWAALGRIARSGFADDLDRIAFGCRTPGGRLLFGGGSNAAYSYRFGGSPVNPPRAASQFTEVERRLREYFPGPPEAVVEHRWSGPLAITFDRVCSMGVMGEHRNVYYALGYSGHGLALAALAGRVLSDLHAGNHDDWRDLPFYQRRMPWIPPEPLRWAGFRAYTALTGRSPRQH